MPPPRVAQAAGGLASVVAAARQYLITRGIKQPDETLLGGAVQAARSKMSNWREWVFARVRETFTTDGTDSIFLSQGFAGEVGVYQTTGDKGKIEPITADEYDQLKLVDSTRQSNLQFYAIFNAKDMYFYPLPSSGVGISVTYNLDLMDTATELPARFFAAALAWVLFFYGAPPPDGKYSWFDVAASETDKLAFRDKRASGRRPIIPNLEPEEIIATWQVAGW